MIASILKFAGRNPIIGTRLALDMITGRVSREGLIGYLVWLARGTDLGESLIRLLNSATAFRDFCATPVPLTETILQHQTRYASPDDDVVNATPQVGEVVRSMLSSFKLAPPGKLRVDSARWWEALKLSGTLAFTNGDLLLSSDGLLPPTLILPGAADLLTGILSDSESYTVLRSILDAVYMTSKATAKYLSRPTYGGTEPSTSASSDPSRDLKEAHGLQRTNWSHILPSVPSTLLSGVIHYLSSLSPGFFSGSARVASGSIWLDIVSLTMSLGTGDQSLDPLTHYTHSCLPLQFSEHAVDQLLENCKYLPATAWRSVSLVPVRNSAKKGSSKITPPVEVATPSVLLPLASSDLLLGMIAHDQRFSQAETQVFALADHAGVLSLSTPDSSNVLVLNCLACVTALTSSPFVTFLLNGSQGEDGVLAASSSATMPNDTRHLSEGCRYVSGEGKTLIRDFVPSLEASKKPSAGAADGRALLQGALGGIATSILTKERDRIEDFIAEALVKAQQFVESLRPPQA